jgi:tetratricopeptide (TPR) repeat protein
MKIIDGVCQLLRSWNSKAKDVGQIRSAFGGETKGWEVTEGAILIEEGDFDRAAKFFKKLQSDPDRSMQLHALAGFAQIAAAQQDYERALEFYSTIVQESPDVESITMKATLLRKCGQTNAADEHFRWALRTLRQSTEPVDEPGRQGFSTNAEGPLPIVDGPYMDAQIVSAAYEEFLLESGRVEETLNLYDEFRSRFPILDDLWRARISDVLARRR